MLRVHFEPHIRAIRTSHPSVTRLRALLQERHGLSDHQINSLLDGLIGRVIDEVGGRYLGHMEPRIRRIAELRTRLAEGIDSIVLGTERGEPVTAAGLNEIFTDLQSQLDGIRTPREHLTSPDVIPESLASDLINDIDRQIGASPSPTPRRSMGAAEFIDRLEGADRTLMQEVNDLAPTELRGMINEAADIGSDASRSRLRRKLRTQGMSEAEIAEAIRLIEDRAYHNADLTYGQPISALPQVVQGPHVAHPAGPRAPRPQVVFPVEVFEARRLSPGEFRHLPDGGVVICNEIGPGVDRLHLERSLALPKEVGLPGFHRSHSQGAGFGGEFQVGIFYAPAEVNLQVQNLGIEQFVRDLPHVLAEGNTLHVTTVTHPHPTATNPSSVHPDAQRLAHISYRLEVVSGGETHILFEASISVANSIDNPKVVREVHPVNDFREFLR